MPQGQEIRKSQEKLGKMTKFRKSQVKMGVFEKSQENSGKNFLKTSDFVSSNLQNSLYLKAFDWLKIY